MVEKTVDPVLSTWGCLNRQSRSSAAKLVDAKICVTSFEIFLLVTENLFVYFIFKCPTCIEILDISLCTCTEF